ncbi:MAG: AraC family transcriptional regulator [Lachnospiraceae bacterium]
MIRLLIADDEPLVQVGIKSMLNWEQLGIEVVGTAFNGEIAYQQILQYAPEIVISDIKMPIMTGLELARKCQEDLGKIPLFIFITSYEEFDFVKTALSVQAVDYLIKLELDKETLEASVKKALSMLEERKGMVAYSYAYPTLHSYKEKFFLKLIYNLFDNENQFTVQTKELGLTFHDQIYQIAYGEIHENPGNHSKLENLLNNSLQMIKEILSKYVSSYLLSLDKKHFCIIFYYPDHDTPPNINFALEGLSIVHNYFNVTLTIGIGNTVSDPLYISQSFQESRQAFALANEKNSVVYYSGNPGKQYTAFNMALFKAQLSEGFEEFNADILYETLTEIIELFSSYPSNFLQVIDGASNILYLTLSLLPDGEKEISQIFADYNNGYRSLHQLNNTEQVINWLITLRDGLCKIIDEKKTLHKNTLILNIQKYMIEHIDERLVLNEIADLFGLSPNYLSTLFKKTCNIGFSEYISQKKIAKAKTMLLNPELKVYQVAEILSFENAFYFSKVFKKIEGISPRNYVQQAYVKQNQKSDSE